MRAAKAGPNTINNRNITGKGELIETSLVSSALSMSMGAVPDYFLNNKNFGKHGNSDRFSSPSNTYKAKDGYIHVMAGSDDRFKGLVHDLIRTRNRIIRLQFEWGRNDNPREFGITPENLLKFVGTFSIFIYFRIYG